MKKYVLKYGFFVGGVNVLGIVSMIFAVNGGSLINAEIVGYTLMPATFCFVYFGTKNYRDEALGGSITLGRGLFVGLLMILVASVIYVLIWLIVYYGFIPDFIEKYSKTCLEKMKKEGSNEMDLMDKMQQLEQMKELYKNPLFVILITFSEILPVGILAAFIVSLVVRRKVKPEPE